MTNLFDNPIGLDGFEFIEFCPPEKGLLEPVFETMGFISIAHHRSKDVDLWRQGGINVIVNYDPRALPRISPPNMDRRLAASDLACAKRLAPTARRSPGAPSPSNSALPQGTYGNREKCRPPVMVGSLKERCNEWTGARPRRLGSKAL